MAYPFAYPYNPPPTGSIVVPNAANPSATGRASSAATALAEKTNPNPGTPPPTSSIVVPNTTPPGSPQDKRSATQAFITKFRNNQ